jgi:hypothetical protein
MIMANDSATILRRGASWIGLCLIAMGSPFLASCAVPVVVPKLPQATQAQLQTDLSREVCRLGRDGDWLVVRQAKMTDNLVVLARNEPLSHAALLDRTHQRVIQANGSHGVHEVSLDEFFSHCQRLHLIRPQWRNDDESGRQAVEKARTWVGRNYDFAGLIGLGMPQAYYCSELTIKAYPVPESERRRLPRPVAPDQLYFYGRIIYDSGPMRR